MARHVITWKETRTRLRQDRQRLLLALKRDGIVRPILAAWYPAYLCVWLHRISHYLAGRRHGVLARGFWHVNLLLTGADIHPECDLGGGLLIPHPAGVSMAGSAGADLTVMALAGIGGEIRKNEDIGAGPGLPILGAGVHLSPHSGILGPVRIGDRVHVAPGCIVTRDVPDDAVIDQAPPHVRLKGPPA